MKIVICFPNSVEHYSKCSVSFLSIYDSVLNTMDSYPIELIDIDNVSLPFIDESVFVFNKRLFDKFYQVESYDLETQYWLKTGEAFPEIKILNKFLYFYKSFDNLYRFIPYVKYQEISTKVIELFLSVTDIMSLERDSIFYKDIVFPSLSFVEMNGLCIDIPKFNGIFHKSYTSSLVHSFYNIHTITGRPSNTYDSVNYNALNKQDESRSCFISRFPDGFLVEFDFEAYHLQLIAKLINYEMPKDKSIHEYLGEKYFNKSKISDAEYDKSKKLSFTYLYSSHIQVPNIDFFTRIETLKTNIWQEYKNNLGIKTPVSGRKIPFIASITKSKLFSYFMQMIETEFSLLFIHDIYNLLITRNKQSKIILYTYDSILIDFNPRDGIDTLKEIKSVLIKSKILKGTNYKDMENISGIF